VPQIRPSTIGAVSIDFDIACYVETQRHS